MVIFKKKSKITAPYGRWVGEADSFSTSFETAPAALLINSLMFLATGQANILQLILHRRFHVKMATQQEQHKNCFKFTSKTIKLLSQTQT